MKKHIGACALSAIALLAAGTAVAAEPRIGEVVQRDYKGAMAEPAGSVTAHEIDFRDEVHALDTVKTGAAGSTALEFLDQTMVQVGAGAELRLDNFVYDPGTTRGAGQISFAVGAFRYVGGKMTTEENIRLHTPTATMVIRGTELVIYVWSDGRTEVNVVSGAVEVSSCRGKGALAMTGMQVTVLPNCTTQVAAAPQLPVGLEALTLPDRPWGAEEGGGEDEDDGGRGGRERPAKEAPAHENNNNNPD